MGAGVARTMNREVQGVCSWGLGDEGRHVKPWGERTCVFGVLTVAEVVLLADARLLLALPSLPCEHEGMVEHVSIAVVVCGRAV